MMFERASERTSQPLQIPLRLNQISLIDHLRRAGPEKLELNQIIDVYSQLRERKKEEKELMKAKKSCTDDKLIVVVVVPTRLIQLDD